MIERQVIVFWFTPEEKTPPEGEIVVASVSGKANHLKYDHAFCLCEWYRSSGWYLDGVELDDFTVHAWCDLEPYGASCVPCARQNGE